METVFDPYFVNFFNVFYTSLPVLGIGIFDQDIDTEYSLRYPLLYRRGQKNRLFNRKLFALSLFEGALTSASLFFLSLLTVRLDSDRSGRELDDRTVMSLCLSSYLIVVLTLKCAQESSSWNIINLAFVLFSLLSYFLVSLVFYLPQLGYQPYCGVMYRLLTTPQYWLGLFVSLVVLLLPAQVYRYYQQNYRPSYADATKRKWRQEDERHSRGGNDGDRIGGEFNPNSDREVGKNPKSGAAAVDGSRPFNNKGGNGIAEEGRPSFQYGEKRSKIDNTTKLKIPYGDYVIDGTENFRDDDRDQDGVNFFFSERINREFVVVDGMKNYRDDDRNHRDYRNDDRDREVDRVNFLPERMDEEFVAEDDDFEKAVAIVAGRRSVDKSKPKLKLNCSERIPNVEKNGMGCDVDNDVEYNDKFDDDDDDNYNKRERIRKRRRRNSLSKKKEKEGGGIFYDDDEEKEKKESKIDKVFGNETTASNDDTASVVFFDTSSTSRPGTALSRASIRSLALVRASQRSPSIRSGYSFSHQAGMANFIGRGSIAMNSSLPIDESEQEEGGEQEPQL